ncbi:hypothetical protein PFISCL1PPCAC_1747, partial [Pristionchus fissidentatus]
RCRSGRRCIPSAPIERKTATIPMTSEARKTFASSESSATRRAWRHTSDDISTVGFTFVSTLIPFFILAAI